ncbi:conserved hypothetical protein [Acidithiobacillus caldus SM-1]|uniref:Uncharacterized protein n=2 Tax=Acidithiobacillus caldus TaxID=33059 RepID=F9ZSF6_ACICS|nr:conserved hypothetical protein [Acidithiobacillus caldus SM-1]AIA56225.1 hypothetical protein Acaty_c2378 [Acidithiobacillus caldus ATCC 51756]QER43815.1 hypothetical protein F0726_00732 [Acidithiobacillus caldus]
MHLPISRYHDGAHASVSSYRCFLNKATSVKTLPRAVNLRRKPWFVRGRAG